MAGRRVKVSGVAGLQVDQVIAWAKSEDVTLLVDSAPPGADEWTFRAIGDDIEGFLSDPFLSPCKGRRLTVAPFTKGAGPGPSDLPRARASAATTATGPPNAKGSVPQPPAPPARPKSVGATKGKGKSKDREQDAGPPSPPLNGTTVMLRNIPNKYTQELLLALLDNNGFRGRYDFVYLPVDYKTGANMGYAFANLLSHEDALMVMRALHGFSRWELNSGKTCEVSWAHPNQGFEANVERYRNSPVMDPTKPDEHKPMVFRNGIRIPFPARTKAVEIPRSQSHTRPSTDGAPAADSFGAGGGKGPGKGKQGKGDGEKGEGKGKNKGKGDGKGSPETGYAVSYRLWFFLSTPEHAAALERKLGLAPDSITLDMKNRRVRADGCTLPGPEFWKKTEEFEGTLLKEELKVPGFSPEELRKNVDLNSLAQEKQVALLLPDQKPLTLQPYQVAVSFNGGKPWDDFAIKDWCKKQLDVDINKVQEVQGQLVAYIGNQSPVEEAKHKLIQQTRNRQLCFSDNSAPTSAAPASQPIQTIGKHMLWIHGMSNEQGIRSLCAKMGVSVFKYVKKGQSLALLTLDLGKHKKDMEQAKKKLLDKPTCFLMIFPKIAPWQAILTQTGCKELIPSAKLTEPGKLHIYVSDPDKISKLSSWTKKKGTQVHLVSNYFSGSQTPFGAPSLTSTASKAPASRLQNQSTAILLSLPGPAQERNMSIVADKVREMGWTCQNLKLRDLFRSDTSSPSRGSTSPGDKGDEVRVKERLCRACWKWIEKLLPVAAELDTDLAFAEVQLKGSGKEVQKAEELLRDRLSKIKAGAPIAIGDQWSGSDQMVRCVRSTCRDLAGKSTDGRAVELDFNKKKGIFQLACWDELEDDTFESVQRDLAEYCASYTEREWTPKSAAEAMGTSSSAVEQRLRELKDEEIRGQAKESGVNFFEWDRKLQRLMLWGPSDGVEAAMASMNDLCRPEKQVTLKLKPDARLVWLLKHNRHKGCLKVLREVCSSFRGLQITIEEATKKASSASAGGNSKGPKGGKEKAAFITIKGKQQQAEEAKQKLEAWFDEQRFKLKSKEVRFDGKDLESLYREYLAGKASEALLHRVALASGSWFEQVEAATSICSTQATRNPAQLAEVQCKGCTVEVWTGNVLANEAEVECVVNPAGPHLLVPERLQGLAGKLRGQGGPGLVAECDRVLKACPTEKVQPGTVVHTEAHDLQQTSNFVHILHGVVAKQESVPDAESFMKSLVMGILKKADEEGILSLVMPLIGTGVLGWPQNLVARLMLDVIVEWKGQGGPGNLSRIVIMDMDDQKTKMFAEDVQARPEFEESSWEAEDPASGDQIQYLFTSFDPKCNDDAEAELKKKLQSLVQEKKLKKRAGIQLEEGETLQEALSDFQEYVLQKSISLQATCEGEEGQETVVLRTLAASAGQLETAQAHLETWNLARANAQAQVKYPPEWPDDADTLKEAILTEVDPNDHAEEFQKVRRTMRDETGPNVPGVVRRQNAFKKKILKVERIINPPLWMDYAGFCQSLKRRGPLNEVWTKHGTGKTPPDQVYNSQHGMDRNYSRIANADGKGGNLWGQAVYTAENATYADQPRYCYELPDGTKQMFLCKFAAGTVSHPEGWSEERKQTRNPPDGHDSIRGLVQRERPSGLEYYAMMAYRDNQVYPFYLVTYNPAEEEEDP